MFHHKLSRRLFLKISLATTLALMDGPEALSRGILEKTENEWLSLYNIHTRERLSVVYKDSSGQYEPGGLESLNRLLRCHFTGEVVAIDIKVIDLLKKVDKEFGGDREIHIISGYRSSRYNDFLYSKGRKVSKNSLHLRGMAIDFRVPGVDLQEVRQAALDLRSGGVGYYPGSDFVHIDSGRFRTW